MRKLIGVLVLVAGLGGLGWATHEIIAPRIEAQIAEQAAGAVSGTELSAVVSGRDISVSGLVTDQAEFDAYMARLAAIDGVRAVSMDDVDRLPLAAPFAVTVRVSGSDWAVEGVVPDARTRRLLEDRSGQVLTDVTRAAGAPDNWSTALELGLNVLDGLGEGAITVSDRVVTVTGTVDTPQDRELAIEKLADLPQGFAVQNWIETRDDGAPFELRAALREGRLAVSGKVPSDFDLDRMRDRFSLGDLTDVVQARIAGGNWAEAAGLGVDALALLIEGDLTLGARDLSLTGVGSPAGIDAADAVLARAPASFVTTSDLSVYGRDFELRLDLTWDGEAATATGVFPAGFAAPGPVGTDVQSSGETLFLPDADGRFTTNADAGVAALGLLRSGQLVATADAITLTGTATSPLVNGTMDAILAAAAPDTTLTRDLTYLDDGTPAAWVVSYAADAGASVEGRMPVGLSPEDLGQALGLARVSSNAVTALEDDTVGNTITILQTAATYLPELERLTFTRNGEGAALDLVLSPGVKIDLVAQDLAQTLPQDVAFSVSPLDPVPSRGARRDNAATGLPEVFIDGFWIPDLDFVTTLDGCTAESRRVLEQGTIGFVSGSAQLDATSIRTINALAAVAVPCVEADLELEVAGHTDAAGDTDQNQVLSQNRAQAVRTAMIARGVPPRAITAIGFGETDPIADNDTAEGRAANRRTDIQWFERGAVRDP